MSKDSVFTHIYGVVTLLGVGLTVWMVKSTSEDDHLYYLSLIAFLLIVIAFSILNKVLAQLDEKTEKIIELNQKIEGLENELTREKSITTYLTGQLGLMTPIARKSLDNE